MKNTISIDFGTSNSTVCWINPRTGMPEVIKDRNGSEKTPSVVYWGPGDEVLVGEAAIARLSDAQHDEAESQDAMQRIVKSVKRDLRHNQPRVLPDGRLMKPVDTVAMILGHLKHLAESAAFHEPVEEVVLTHPVMMTQREKQLLEEAAQKAGFQTIRFKEEPVAAAHGYLAQGTAVGAGLLVFDLGGGTLDLAFLQRAADGSYRMPVECLGDAACGGDDYDQIVYDHWESQMQARHGRGFAASNGEIDPFVLLECRKAKEKLTEMQAARMPHLFVQEGGLRQEAFALTRPEFEALSAACTQKALLLTRRMLQRIEGEGLRVETVLLIGGATRMPLLRRELRAVLPVDPTVTMYADLAVAMGGVPQTTPPAPAPQVVAPTSSPSAPAARAVVARPAQMPMPTPGRTWTVPDVGIEMIWIEPGCFMMGSLGGEMDRSIDETQHPVRLTKGFWLGKYPVTQRQWQELVGGNPSHFVTGKVLEEGGWFTERKVMPDSTQCPVEEISWEECVEYGRQLTGLERAAKRLPGDLVYTLPTEAQWEYACRAGSVGPYAGTFPRGPNTIAKLWEICRLSELGWYAGNADGRTHPVGQKKSNAWGLHDMHGNVWEWCADWYTDTIAGKAFVDPLGPDSGSYRVRRGGGWVSPAQYCRSANRGRVDPGGRGNSLGFRLTLSSVR